MRISGREQLDAPARPLLDRTIAVCRDLSAGVNLIGVFLVGGATRMPLVRTMLHQALGVSPTVVDQPERRVRWPTCPHLATPRPPWYLRHHHRRGRVAGHGR